MRRWPIILSSIATLAVVLAVEAQPPPKITDAPLTWKNLAVGDGEQLYGELCAVCHGAEAKGDGPAAPALRAVTPDLTLLAMKNDGVYPFDEVQRAINGEGEIMLRWDSSDGKKTLYFALAGTGCCFCPTGADIVVWRSPTPLGPWTQLNNQHKAQKAGGRNGRT